MIAHGSIIFNCLIIAITRLDEKAGCQISERSMRKYSFSGLCLCFSSCLRGMIPDNSFSRQVDSSFPYSAPPPTPSTDYSLRTGQRLRRGRTCWGVIRCSFVSLSYKVPSAGPVMKVENTGVRTVTITWKEIPKHQRNGFINYTIFYQVEDGKGFCK